MHIEIHTTVKDMEEARKIAGALVEKRLAACVNIYPVTSVYRWEGEIEEEGEIALSIKSISERFEEIRKAIRALHSYDLPAVTVWEIRGDRDYLTWITDSTQ
jgi:periplasmic divalent cation tolerance protein